LKVFTDDISDFLGIFDELNQGAEINLADMDNKKISKYLEKIFKSLGLSQNEKKEWYQDKELIINNPKIVVNSHVTRILEKKNRKQSVSSESESEDQNLAEKHENSDSDDSGSEESIDDIKHKNNNMKQEKEQPKAFLNSRSKK